MPFDYRPALVKQLDLMRARQADGVSRRGWKVGINVPEVQRRVGLEGPLFGWLDGDHVYDSGAVIEVPYGARLHVEPEVCLRLGADILPGMNPEQVREAVEAMAPALEVVDYAKPADDLEQLVEHSLYHMATVLGPFGPVSGPQALDLASEVSLQVGDAVSEPARADLVPHDPAQLLLQLAGLLDELGEQLRAGDLVLSGSFTVHAMPIMANQVAKADYGRLGLVQCRAVSERS